MSKTIYNEKTSSMPGYGEIFPDSYKEGDKLPVMFFMHGIGELSTKKSLKAAVDFHAWFKKAADVKNIIAVLPQDDGTNLFDDKELVKLLPVIEKYCNGQLCLSGLSRGGGTTISTIMSNSTVKSKVCCYIILCPPTWEGMDEKLFAADDTPVWLFAGAKDAADVATKIDRMVNTVDDIRRAGRTKNFYFSVFPNDDHYIWTEVMGAIGVPPINPTNGAKSWKGFNTVTKIVNGVNTSAPVAIEVECVNNPAIDVYDFFLLQHKGDYKPLPLLSDQAPIPTPIPTPKPVPDPASTPPPTSKTLMRVNITGAGKPGMVNVVLEYTSGPDEVLLVTEVDTVQVNGKTRYTIFDKTEVKRIIEI